MTSSLENFNRVPLSIRESIVSSFASLTLIFTSWALGGYSSWALHIIFLGGIGTFLASIFPMPKSWNGHDELHGNLKNLRRLLVQPYFWAGMLFLGYILVQYINPSAVQAFDEKYGG